MVAKGAIIVTTLLALLYLPHIGEALTERPHFVGRPYIASKTLSGKTGALYLSVTINFAAAGLGNSSLAAYLTSTGGTSYNVICINRDDEDNAQAEPRVVFGLAKGQLVVVRSMNDQVTFNNGGLSLTMRIDEPNCPSNQLPLIRSATLKNIELHIVQHNENSMSELLTFNFGDESLPIAYFDSTPNIQRMDQTTTYGD
jgi:hypothetical protein